MKQTGIVIASVAILIIVLAMLSLTIEAKRDMISIDPVTGSIQNQTHWCWGMKSTPTVHRSPLADWVVRKEGSIKYDWHFLCGQGRSIWGRYNGHAICGPAPVIYPLHVSLIDGFVKQSSDEELQRFVDVMRHGTEAEQRAAVDAACNRAIYAP